MKRCPQCNLDYFDKMIEFCLDDGTKLISLTKPADSAPTVTKPVQQNKTIGDTLNSPFSNVPQTLETNVKNPLRASFPKDTVDSNSLKLKVTSQGYKILEVVPVIVSLAHNWWQWVYLNNQDYSSFSGYFFSANFLMWMFLLLVGAASGLLALKLCRNKGFAYTGLIVLAINLLLFLVPKR